MGCTLTFTVFHSLYSDSGEAQGKAETEEALAGLDSMPVEACVFPEVGGAQPLGYL